MKDTILYDKLDILPGISDEEIRKVGKKLLLKYHPDKNENKEEASKKFIEVKEILDILTDREKRELYHNIGISILNQESNQESNFNNSSFQNFSTFFQNFSNIPYINPGIPNFNNYDTDIIYTIKIDRNIIREDNEYNIYYKRSVICNECLLNKNICEKCNNKRVIETKQIFNNIIIIHRVVCNECKCIKCNNNEYTEEDKKVILNIKGDKIIELIDKKQTIILKKNGNVLKDKITDLVIILSY